MEVRATVALGTGKVHRMPEPKHEASGPTPPDDHAESVTARLRTALGSTTQLHIAGSRRMGCALPEADLDLVAALPGTADPAELRQRVAAALPEARRLREVTGARVPGLRFRVGALDVDLVAVATGSHDPAHAVARRAELGEAAAVALSSVSDADAVRGFVGAEHEAFTHLARRVKAWSRARGLDSAPFGGLLESPGPYWRPARSGRAPTAPPPPAPGVLRLLGGLGLARPHHPVPGRPPSPPTPVTVLTPSRPHRSCTTQVNPAMRELLVRELYEAWELLSADPTASTTAPPPLHRRHAAWAVVTVRTAPTAEFDETLGRVRGRLRALLTSLEEAGSTEAHAWPRPFESAPGLARYAIGLGPTPLDAARLASLSTPWSRGLPGVEVTHAAGGEVPSLH